MRSKLSIILIITSFLNVFCQNKKDDILGKWMATDKSVAVNVYKEGNAFKAKVIWFDERLGSGSPMNSRVDSYNPDSNLRPRKIIGMDILKGLQFNSEKNAMRTVRFMTPRVEEYGMHMSKLKRVIVSVFEVFGSGPGLEKHCISLGS